MWFASNGALSACMMLSVSGKSIVSPIAGKGWCHRWVPMRGQGVVRGACISVGSRSSKCDIAVARSHMVLESTLHLCGHGVPSKVNCRAISAMFLWGSWALDYRAMTQLR